MSSGSRVLGFGIVFRAELGLNSDSSSLSHAFNSRSLSSSRVKGLLGLGLELSSE